MTMSIRRAARVPSDVKTIVQRRPRVNRAFAGSDDLVRVTRFPSRRSHPSPASRRFIGSVTTSAVRYGAIPTHKRCTPLFRTKISSVQYDVPTNFPDRTQSRVRKPLEAPYPSEVCEQKCNPPGECDNSKSPVKLASSRATRLPEHRRLLLRACSFREAAKGQSHLRELPALSNHAPLIRLCRHRGAASVHWPKCEGP